LPDSFLFKLSISYGKDIISLDFKLILSSSFSNKFFELNKLFWDTKGSFYISVKCKNGGLPTKQLELPNKDKLCTLTLENFKLMGIQEIYVATSLPTDRTLTPYLTNYKNIVIFLRYKINYNKIIKKKFFFFFIS